MQIDKIGDYGRNFIRSKAKKLIGHFRFTWSDFENLQQDMLLDLIQRLPKYIPSKSPINAFITMVVKNKVASIIEQRMSPSQEHVRNEVSINTVLHQDDCQVELGDTLCTPQVNSDMNTDLPGAIAGFSKEQRAIWELRVQGWTWTEISAQTGIPRPTIYDRWEKIESHLKQALRDYFEEA
ncbi:MAG: sigma-70 family RNA polymerase sigma factor [Phycisphaerae bacterium]|nr:sigma-70 family RNA polymerase sigma factor [Phycisphaerae bacterium]